MSNTKITALITIGLVIAVLLVGGLKRWCNQIELSNKETICYFTDDLKNIRTSVDILPDIKTPIIKLTYNHNYDPSNICKVTIVNLNPYFNSYYWLNINDSIDAPFIELETKDSIGETVNIQIYLKKNVSQMKEEILPTLQTLHELAKYNTINDWCRTRTRE